MAARRCANPDCGRDLAGRRPQATTCSERCRVAKHRQSGFEHERFVFEERRAGRISCEAALLWVLFPDQMRESASVRVDREAVAA